MTTLTAKILFSLVAVSLPNIALAQSANTAAELTRRMIERRAIEAVIWGMPAVNYDRMFEAGRAASAGPNQIVYWSRPISWMNQTLTPNPNTIYLMPDTVRHVAQTLERRRHGRGAIGADAA